MTAKNPRSYPNTMKSAESGRPMVRGEKLVAITVAGKEFRYRQPGWWCSLADPDDDEGQLVDEDNLVAEMARRTAEALAAGEVFTPALIRAIRLRLGLSQVEAGRVFGAGDNSFDKYERGEIRPSTPTRRLLKLAMERPGLFRKPRGGPLKLPSAPDAALVRKTLRETRLGRLYAPLLGAGKKKKAPHAS